MEGIQRPIQVWQTFCLGWPQTDLQLSSHWDYRCEPLGWAGFTNFNVANMFFWTGEASTLACSFSYSYNHKCLPHVPLVCHMHCRSRGY
jgi:hypothetical protein